MIREQRALGQDMRQYWLSYRQRRLSCWQRRLSCRQRRLSCRQRWISCRLQWLSCLRSVAGDRRGVTAMVFAVSAVGLLGMVGLGTEVGAWYLARSAADNAADAAACAAALAVSNGSSYQDAGLNTAAADGYAAGGPVAVTVNNPPATGGYAGNPAAAEVVIDTTFTPVVAGLFTKAIPTVASRSVAMVEPVGNACAVSLTGDMQITQATGDQDKQCYFASNAGDGTAVNTPAASISAYGVTSVGSCFGCNGPPALLRQAASYQPPTTNPYTAIDSLSFGSFQPVTIPSTMPANYTLVPATATGTFNTGTPAVATYAWTSGQPFYAYEGNLTIPAGTTLTLVPGVYFFVNASLTMLNGSTVQCRLTASGAGVCAPGNAGVTIVLLGNPASSVGNLTIQPTATVVLGALNSQTGSFSNSSGLGAGYTALNGILFYRRGLAGGENIGAPGVNITGNTGSTPTILNGGMYFPNSYVWYGANGNSNDTATCAIVAAAYLSLTNAPSLFSSNDCPTVYKTPMPQVEAVRVVE
jgi:Flp pilus assembly protein TadG